MIKTGLSREEVIDFITGESPLKMFAIQLDDTLIIKKVRDGEEINGNKNLYR